MPSAASTYTIIRWNELLESEACSDSDELRDRWIIRLPRSGNEGVIRKEQYDATNRWLEQMDLIVSTLMDPGLLDSWVLSSRRTWGSLAPLRYIKMDGRSHNSVSNLKIRLAVAGCIQMRYSTSRQHKWQNSIRST